MSRPMMQPCAETHGDFMVVEGTFSTDKHGMVKVVPTVVDGLGKSVMVADSSFPTESKEDTISTLRWAGAG